MNTTELEKQFSALYTEMAKKNYNKNKDLCEADRKDILQDAFVSALMMVRTGKIKSRTHLEGYLTVKLYYLGLDARKVAFRDLPLMPELAETLREEEAGVRDVSYLEAVNSLLPKQDSALLSLILEADMSPTDLGKLIGLKRSGACKVIHKFVRRLREDSCLLNRLQKEIR